jgi:hypothetical protein
MFLALLFLLFSVGVPIVVASCPMARNADRRMCSQCLPGRDGQSQSIVKYVDRSCCATVIAAARNTTEFVRSGNEQGLASSVNFILPPFDHTVIAPVHVRIAAPETGPLVRLREDIPLFVSSLLI